MIIDLSNYRLKEDICVVSADDGPTTPPVIKLSDVLIGGKDIAGFMAFTTGKHPIFNENVTPGVQLCRYELLPEEIGLTSYYEIYQALLTAFGITEEELLAAEDKHIEFSISSVKLGDAIFNATSAWAELSANNLNVGITGQTFYIDLDVNFKNPNLVEMSGGGTTNQYFTVDITR